MAEEHVSEVLVDDCVCALEALRASPDLTLESLEPGTIEAIERAQRVVHAVEAAQERTARAIGEG